MVSLIGMLSDLYLNFSDLSTIIVANVILQFELISLACVRSGTHNLQPVFLRIYGTKRGSLCQAFLLETVESGNKNHCVTEATHVL